MLCYTAAGVNSIFKC